MVLFLLLDCLGMIEVAQGRFGKSFMPRNDSVLDCKTRHHFIQNGQQRMRSFTEKGNQTA